MNQTAIDYDDAEVRGKLLRHFFSLRHANGGAVPVTEEILAGSDHVRRDVVVTICRQLEAANLIQWRPSHGSYEGYVIGMATITGHGADVVEGRREPSIVIFSGSEERHQPLAFSEPRPSGSSGPTTVVELLTLKPSFWGMSLDLKEAARRLKGWWQRRK